ncbi:MAG: hypothetical protein ACTSRU_03360 [Candidatus Hodarchaeales archaeon]
MPVDPSIVVLIILAFILLLIGFVKYRKRSFLSQSEKAIHEGRLVDAIHLLLKVDVIKAIKLVVESPRGTQALLNRHLQKTLSDADREKILVEVAKEYQENHSPHYASSAYLLADKIIRAAEVYILAGFTKNAIDVIEDNPHLVRKKNEAIRQLSKFAYENGKYLEAVELLKYIGAQEEAAAVLTAASDILRRNKRSDEAERLEKANAPDLNPKRAIDNYLGLATSYIQREDMENARATLTMVKHILDYPPADIEDISSLKIEYNRMIQVMKRLEIARDLLRERQLDQARAHYAEILDIASDLVPATVFAEAGLAYENFDNELSAEYYTQAASRSKTTNARKRFIDRAMALRSAPRGVKTDLSAPSLDIISSLESEKCIICKRKISWDSDYIRCPHCNSPAHYAHMAEWLKIKGSCPVCQKKVWLKSKN